MKVEGRISCTIIGFGVEERIKFKLKDKDNTIIILKPIKKTELEKQLFLQIIKRLDIKQINTIYSRLEHELEKFISNFYFMFGEIIDTTHKYLINVKYEILNENELIESGFNPPTTLKFDVKFQPVIKKERIEEFIEILKENLDIWDKINEKIRLAINFYRSALENENGHIKFIQLWITFEILIIYLYTLNSPSKKVNIKSSINYFNTRFVSREFRKEILDRIISPINNENLSPQDLFITLYWNGKTIAEVLYELNLIGINGINYSSKLNIALKGTDKEQQVMYLFHCLFQIRNKIIHGTKFPIIIPEKAMFPLNHLFEFIVKKTIHDLIAVEIKTNDLK